MASLPRPRGRVRRRWRRLAVGVLVLGAVLVGVAGFGVFRFMRGLFSWGHEPSSTTGLREVAAVETAGGLVVAAHPEATRIGSALLAAGGHAVDAAIGVQLALGLVEPDCSGIGGGAFLLVWDAEREQLHAYDGREQAPSRADAGYLMKDGAPLRFDRAMIGGRSVGVPGVMRMLELAHREHGRLPWARTFDDAIALAEHGFEVSPRLHHLVAYDPIVPTVPALRDYFLDGEGAPWPVGHRLQNPTYAATLRALQSEGADALHEGPIAADIVSAVESAVQPSAARLVLNVVQRGLGMTGGGEATAPAPGPLTADDLAGYRAIVREPVCRPYRDYRVCAFGPPTSGGIAVLQVLAVLERFELSTLEPTSAAAMHLLADAQRLAYLDRARWVADPDAVAVPVAGLLDDAYLSERGQTIELERALVDPQAGTPPGADASRESRPSPERPGTSHFSIVDGAGNIVSMTTSIEGPFGAHVMVRGFLLNNELTDFSFAAEDEHGAVANAPGPNKRPRSSMSPLVIFDAHTQEPRFVVGSPGGSRIIAYVAQTAVALMDWGLSPQQAVELPHVIAQDETVEIETIGWPDDDARDQVVDGLEAMGHDVDLAMLQSGLHVIEIQGEHRRSGTDPRREGVALAVLVPAPPGPPR